MTPGSPSARQFRNQIIWFSSTVILAAIWLAFLYLFEPNEFGILATAIATACLIEMIQHHYKAS